MLARIELECGNGGFITVAKRILDLNTEYQYGFKDEEKYIYKAARGLTEELVREISAYKNEPEWMLDIRLKALNLFHEKPMPNWGPNLKDLDFDSIHYYIKPSEKQGKSWEEVPEHIKDTFEKLGIPEAERKFLAGVSAQYESEVVYHSLREDLEKQGVIFIDTDTAVREYPELVKEYFGTVIPVNDNKFAALNTAVWSGGSFIWVPKGVHVEIPLQAYFRINAQNMGQFERTLIIAEPGSSVHYVEGCTAPIYSSDSLHSAVVEIIVKKDARVRYSTIQNWSKNVYNLVTKRAVAYENATMEWIDGNIGSKVTMKYPAVYMLGEGARADILSIAVSGPGQTQDAGAKIVHAAKNTSANVVSKGISFGGGLNTYRGLVTATKGAEQTTSSIKCDTLLFDNESRSDTYPTMDVRNENIEISHEATVSKIAEDQLFYLMSRGLSEEEATLMIVNGFIEPFTKELPMEYAIEMNRLIRLEMEGAVG